MKATQDHTSIMIRACDSGDVTAMLQVINRAAAKYRGVIPDDRWHDPYMPLLELEHEISVGVTFIGAFANGELVGIMGAQVVKGVTLIRHAYVLPEWQGHGVGSKLIQSHLAASRTRVLVGTWAAAEWATSFYIRHGFVMCSQVSAAQLLKAFWDVPDRQIETSVVLAKPPVAAGDLLHSSSG